MKSLTQDQLAYIKSYERSKSPRTIARDLKLELSQVHDALETIRTPDSPERRKPGNMRLPSSWLTLAMVLAIVVLGFLAYSNNTACDWHFDDNHSITGNSAIQFPTFKRIYEFNLYRQVLYWTFAVSWHFHGPHVWGWHIENNAIHVLNGLLVFWFALLTLRTPGASKATRWPELVAGFAALVFVLHPIQTQSVTYITQRTESLAATFYLLALVLYAAARVRRLEGRATGENIASLPLAAGVAAVLLAAGLVVWKPGATLPIFVGVTGLAAVGAIGGIFWLASRKRTDLVEGMLLTGALAATFFGCETKEIAGTIPAAILLWEVLFTRPHGSPNLASAAGLRTLAATAPWATMLAVLPFLALRAGLSVKFLAPENSEEHAPGFSISGPEYFFTQLNVLATYVRLLLLPYNQTLDYDYVKSSSLFASSAVSPPPALSLLVLVGLAAVAAKTWRRRPLVSWSILFALLVLAPTSTFFVLPDFIYEHRLYLPLVGAALLGALALERAIRFVVRDATLARQVFVGVAVVTLAACTTLTRARNLVWADEETLWKDCIAKAPGKPRPKTNLGLYYQNNEPQKLICRNGVVVKGKILDGDTHGQPGVWIVEPTLSEKEVYGVRKTDCDGGPVDFGGIDRAEKLFDEAIALDKYYFKARNNYAIAEVQDGSRTLERAIQVRKLAEKATGPEADAINRKADELGAEATKHFERAAAHLVAIIESRPRDNVAMSNLANLYFQYLDKLDEAIVWMEKSVAQSDSQPIVHAVLGEMYFVRASELSKKGDYDGSKAQLLLAVTQYQKFLERVGGGDPNSGHIDYRRKVSEQGIKDGGKLPDLDLGSNQGPQQFRGVPGLEIGKGGRFKPGAPAGPQPPGPGK